MLAHVDDLWYSRGDTSKPLARCGRGRRWRVRAEGWPTVLCRTKGEADAVLADRIRLGPPKPKSMTTMGELIDRWLKTKKRLAPSSYDACETAAFQTRPDWEHKLAADVIRSDIETWLGGLQSQVPGGDHKGPPVMRPAAGSTRAKALQCLSGALRIGVEIGAVEENVAAGISPGRQAKRAVRWLSIEELGRLADAAGQIVPSSAAMVWTLGTTGPRIGEATAFDVADLDATRRRLIVEPAKSPDPRDLPLTLTVLDMLKPLIKGRPGAAPLFLSAKGVRWTPDNWRRQVFEPAAAAIGRPDLTPHVLRHTAVSLAIAAGADVKAIQRMCGHRSARTTLDIYGHLWPDSLDGVADRMEAALKEKRL